MAGVAIWCTHFGYDAGVPIGFDPAMTVVSLLIAVIGSTIGFVLAGSRWTRFTPTLGGAIVGLAIAAMHYTGMMAYRVQGIVSWDRPYLVTSIVLSVALSALALHLAMRPGRHPATLMAGVRRGDRRAALHRHDRIPRPTAAGEWLVFQP